MKQKLLIFLGLIFLITLLIGLNAASYVQKEKFPDSEIYPNRSTYNVGTTGTRAFYDLLKETGRNVTRWQESPLELLSYGENTPSTFVVIGKTRREFEKEEIEHLLQWVLNGGRLVIIDREPPAELIKSDNVWNISISKPDDLPFFDTDPSNQKQMTEATTAARPVQPTIFTKKVNAVQQSRFASSIQFARTEGAQSSVTEDEIYEDAEYEADIKQAPANVENEEIEGNSDEERYTEDEEYSDEENTNDNSIEENYDEELPPPTSGDGSGEGYGIGNSSNSNKEIILSQKPINDPIQVESADRKLGQIAPTIHLANNEKTILIDYPRGYGRIVFLSDPYIVSNGGISLVDNAQLAINTIVSGDGIIAFDEYHQGYGSNNNRLLSYFEGTPVIAFFLQLAILIFFLFFTQSRRFARALPANEPNRLSKLEYVSAMAQLQQRTKAFDLAIENIYKDFRRRVSRLLGVDNSTIARSDLAKLVAERSNLNADQIDDLMFKCEDIIHGEPTNKKEVLTLTSKLRELENELGLQRSRKRKSKK